MDNILKNHPCIIELKAIYTEENKKYIRENRLNLLKRGEVFPKISEKVIRISGILIKYLNKHYAFYFRN